MKKTIAIHQPNYLPWLGFYDKIAKADSWVVFDDVMIGNRSQSPVNRNLVKTPQGKAWLTVPVYVNFDDLINTISVDYEQDWPKDHLKTIFFNYKKAPNFDKIYPLLEKEYSKKIGNLAELNLAFIDIFLKFFGIKKERVRSSELKVPGKRNELLINICKKVGADVYLAGQGSKDYMDLAMFKKAGIEVVWQEFIHPAYPQLWGEFIPKLSALDYVLNCDPMNFFEKPGSN